MGGKIARWIGHTLAGWAQRLEPSLKPVPHTPPPETIEVVEAGEHGPTTRRYRPIAAMGFELVCVPTDTENGSAAFRRLVTIGDAADPAEFRASWRALNKEKFVFENGEIYEGP